MCLTPPRESPVSQATRPWCWTVSWRFSDWVWYEHRIEKTGPAVSGPHGDAGDVAQLPILPRAQFLGIRATVRIARWYWSVPTNHLTTRRFAVGLLCSRAHGGR